MRRSSDIPIFRGIFGSASFYGGLFFGYMSDPAKVGRCFTTFGPWTYPSNAIYRGGKLCAYLVMGDIHGTGSKTELVGAQAISNMTWDPTVLKWSTAPSLTPSSAPYTVSITYNPTASPTVTPVWKFW